MRTGRVGRGRLHRHGTPAGPRRTNQKNLGRERGDRNGLQAEASDASYEDRAVAMKEREEMI